MYWEERVFENMEQDKTFLGTEPIGKLLLKLAFIRAICDKKEYQLDE